MQILWELPTLTESSACPEGCPHNLRSHFHCPLIPSIPGVEHNSLSAPELLYICGDRGGLAIWRILLKDGVFCRFLRSPILSLPRSLTNGVNQQPESFQPGLEVKEPLTSKAASRRSRYSTSWCCCPWRGPTHGKRNRRGAQGLMAAGKRGQSRECAVVCSGPLPLTPAG